MFEWIVDPNAWLALGTLTILEIVLGIDNIIFLSLVVAKLPKAQQNKARRIGLLAAMGMRLCLLASIAWVIRLTHPLFTLLDRSFYPRSHLIARWAVPYLQGNKEIHETIEGGGEDMTSNVHSFWAPLSKLCCWILSLVWIRSSPPLVYLIIYLL